MATKTKHVGEVISKVALFGAAGWVAENALCQQERYSSVFRGAKIPFMPVYAVNGIVLTAVSSAVKKWDWPGLARFLTYAVVGTGVEWTGCWLDKQVLGGTATNFGSIDALTRLSEGCVNFTRSALWGGMGLIAEKV